MNPGPAAPPRQTPPALRVVVCIKQVPETSSVGIDPQRGTLLRAGVPAILNPLDAYAIEMAVRLAGTGQTVALTMGPPSAEAVLREAVARGCQRAVLASDPTFAGSDTWATSLVLSRAIACLAPVDLVLCGRMAIDGDTAQVPPGLAALLDWPQITEARSLSIHGRILHAIRRVDDAEERLEPPLPAVATVLKAACVPRLPNLPRALSARRCCIENLDRAHLGLPTDACGLDGSPTRVERIFPPPPHGTCRIHASIRALVTAIQQEGLGR